MSAYYNEHDPFAAAWLRELIKAGVIAPGDVDERDIREVKADDLRGYTQCHFFAGIGVWSYALRQAGWPDDKPAWTGSCPCQPFSVAGKRSKSSDERHLWPAWFNLIRESRPEFIFGEQVASDDGLAWLDLVHADMEGQGYTVGAVDTCAAGFGSPMRSQRLYFVAQATGNRATRHASEEESQGKPCRAESPSCGEISVMVAPKYNGHIRQRELAAITGCDESKIGIPDGAGAVRGFWAGEDWILCRTWDDSGWEWRPIQSGTFPLAHGTTKRVGRLRGYGNALVAPQAQAFIESVMETLA